MNILGIGQDLVELPRIRDMVERHSERFLKRCFTPAELDYCLVMKDPIPHLAARFAAKEACVKALGTGIAEGVSWLDIEIRRMPDNRPTIHLSGQARHRATELGIHFAHVTMTHERGLASALVIFEGNGIPPSPFD